MPARDYTSRRPGRQPLDTSGVGQVEYCRCVCRSTWLPRGNELRKRTRAREAALKVLYQLDLRGEEILAGLDAVLARVLGPDESDGEVREFARGLVVGCWAHRAELDERIRAIAENWELGRMAVVDRNVLRLAAYELLFLSDVPAKVAINEAIELAKRFSTADSGAFVNGILDRIRINSEDARKTTTGEQDGS